MNGVPFYDNNKCHVRNNKGIKKGSLEFIDKFMTEEEYDRFMKTEDIYFDANRMRKIFPKVKIINY